MDRSCDQGRGLMESEFLHESDRTGVNWTIGVCVMSSKVKSSSMHNLLKETSALGTYELVYFGDDLILNSDFSTWPICDILISFFSKDLPIERVVKYIKLREPFHFNDLTIFEILFDRSLMLEILSSIGVRTPRRFLTKEVSTANLGEDAKEFLKRKNIVLPSQDGVRHKVEMIDEDTLKVGPNIIRKPFVEKPVFSEDHNIRIYYPKNQNGGMRQLYRKIGNKSSDYYSGVVYPRTDGDYVYEEFLNMDNAEDIKFYMFGKNLVYAESRKSPVVDGIVHRDVNGKEVRSAVSISDEEKEIARNICDTFEQKVCGFDTLRVRGVPYVVEVNGWSLAKSNMNYYTQCAKELDSAFSEYIDSMILSDSREPCVFRKELIGYITVIRHSDRTTKHKIKIESENQQLIEPFMGNSNEVTYKYADGIKQFLDICSRVLLSVNEKNIETIRDHLLHKKDLYTNLKVQIKRKFNSKAVIQFVIKWGGVLTQVGEKSTSDLGKKIKVEISKLNKDLLNNIKVFASAESRVMDTAKALIKNLSDSEIEIRAKDEMLDINCCDKAEFTMDKMEKCLGLMAPNWNPRSAIFSFLALMKDMEIAYRENMSQEVLKEIQWCNESSLQDFKFRWEKVFEGLKGMKEFPSPANIFSTYSELYFDLQHNRKAVNAIFVKDEIHLAREAYIRAGKIMDAIYLLTLADTPEARSKLSNISTRLLIKDIKEEIDSILSGKPTMKFYFTKKEKIIPLLVYISDRKLMPPFVSDPCYLSQIAFSLYKDKDEKHYVRVSYTDGLNKDQLSRSDIGDENPRLSMNPLRFVSDYISLDEFLYRL